MKRVALLVALLISGTALADGRVVVGDRAFRVGRAVSQGYTGVVHEGYDEQTGERVALKLIKPARDSEQTRQGLHNELWIAHRVAETDAHAPLARGIGIGKTDEAQPRMALAMHWVGGKALGSLGEITQARPPGKSVRFALQMLRGLHALHAHGWAHHDLHFGNIMVEDERSSSLRVIDTGEVAATTGAWTGNVHPTSAPAGGTNLQADLYSAGMMLKGMLTGDVRAPDSAIPDVHVSVHGASVSLRDIVARATAVQPERRFQSAKAMMDALEPFAHAAN